MTISRASVPAASRSARLTVYPKGMLSSPLDQRSASFTVTPGGPALAVPAAPGGPAGELPRGADRLTQSFTDLVARRHLTAGFALIALLIAVALGAVHALAPGHGKTIMAAQAVSRGRRGLRDILAATLTGIGVFITGSGRWLATRAPGLRDRAHRIPARLVPAGSAVLVVLLGVALAARSLATALGVTWPMRAARGAAPGSGAADRGR